ncbi:MAG: hypothetical protein EXS15_05050 [Phycisphaerales bacterium]|nr:hypothetical protein [Phycisphaerales bacterium]
MHRMTCERIIVRLTIPFALFGSLCSCESVDQGLSTHSLAPVGTPGVASRSPQSATLTDRPPAIFNGQSVEWSELRPRLLELSGASILEEVLLERLLLREVQQAAIAIDDDAVAMEERAARDALSSDPARAAQLLTALRSEQGLGQIRFAALLWRNAALRALAAREVTLTEESIRQAFDASHGPRRIARLIVVADIAHAQRVRVRLGASESFAEVAAQMSIDSSAARGGLLAPIARLDPSYPPAFREVLFSLAPGEVSQAVLLEDGYAIIQLRDEIAGDGRDPATSRAEDERTARRVQERVEMDRIARTLLGGAKPTVFDESLSESWQQRGRGQK